MTTTVVSANLCKRLIFAFAFALSAGTPAGSAPGVGSVPSVSEPNAKLSLPQFERLARRCAPGVSPQIMEGIARTESAMYPYALSINYPLRSARHHGYIGKVIMRRQPRSKTEAIHWARWYLEKGYTVSVGLVQVNVEMADRFHVMPMALFEPCVNLAAGAKILSQDYAFVSHDENGLIQAYSLYNSGSASLGISNGYASTVVQNTH